MKRINARFASSTRQFLLPIILGGVVWMNVARGEMRAAFWVGCAAIIVGLQ